VTHQKESSLCACTKICFLVHLFKNDQYRSHQLLFYIIFCRQFLDSGIITGVLPRSVANLTQLEELVLPNIRLVNDLAPEIWQLPRLIRIKFDRAAVRVVFPPTISESITNVCVVNPISLPLRLLKAEIFAFFADLWFVQTSRARCQTHSIGLE
jgi:hypothetical protein